MSNPGSSDQEELVVWQAPYFEQPAVELSQPSADELAVLAQARAYQEGKQEGLEAGAAEVRDMVSRVTSVLDEMEQPFRNLDKLVTQELAQVAMLLAEKIVRRELSINSEVVTRVVTEAISTLYKLDGDIVIFLNPADLELIRETAPEALEGKSWKLVEDSSLLPGGCQVKTPTSFVDASVEKQMKMVFGSLMESSENTLES